MEQKEKNESIVIEIDLSLQNCDIFLHVNHKQNDQKKKMLRLQWTSRNVGKQYIFD